jgi:tetratricopeptide (TPR) repeat protein
MLLVATTNGFGQKAESAEKIFQQTKDSIFLVYLDDASGKPAALGSAFVVGPHILATNAHVANAGAPVLAVGPVRVPLKVIRTDEKNDLALLSVDIDLTSTPLSLALDQPSPGQEIFAIGNPEGLENTISQGIVSGVRTVDQSELIQITSPISHGSSGGPILNTRGEVIGVAVGMFQDGQNLNFAVPIKYLRKLLDAKSELTSIRVDCTQTMSVLSTLFDARSKEDYSDDPSSDYQKHSEEMHSSANIISNDCHQPEVLRNLACLSINTFDLGEPAVRAARELVTLVPTSESRSLLAYVLYDYAEDENLRAATAKDGSPEKAEASNAFTTLLGEAEREANQTVRQFRSEPLQIADFVIAKAKEDRNDIVGAIPLHSIVVTSPSTVCGTDLVSASFRDLVTDSDKEDRPDDAERWFRRYAAKYEPAPYEWDSEGDRRWKYKDYASAADAYERAATTGNYYTYDYCYASVGRYIKDTPDADQTLTDGRKCIDASVKNTRDADRKQFDNELPTVYRLMAEVLNKRGVYDQALEYVKEAIAARPDDAFSLDDEAEIYENLQRPSECESAAKAAIRASDGKYSWMQFKLGNCFFDEKNFSQAADSFRIAAEADKSNVDAAFNLGLSLAREGFTADAETWFREALRRNPDDATRAKIMNLLK